MPDQARRAELQAGRAEGSLRFLEDLLRAADQYHRMLESMRNQKGEKPRLVHRLDRETSGVLVVARTRGAAAELTKSFRHRDTEKTYWAIVKEQPNPESGTLKHRLIRDQKKNKSFVTKKTGKEAKEAVLHYQLIAKSNDYSLLEIDLETPSFIRCRLRSRDRNLPMKEIIPNHLNLMY